HELMRPSAFILVLMLLLTFRIMLAALHSLLSVEVYKCLLPETIVCVMVLVVTSILTGSDLFTITPPFTRQGSQQTVSKAPIRKDSFCTETFGLEKFDATLLVSAERRFIGRIGER